MELTLPDDHTASMHVSLRVPGDLVTAFDRLAVALERPRSWVMVRALRQYIEDGEGAEIAEDSESLGELDRAESVPAEQVVAEVGNITTKPGAERVRRK